MDDERELIYRLKTLRTPGKKKPLRIILQNENGPCPLLAISNILLLTGDLEIHPDYAFISSKQLLSFLKDYLTKQKPPKRIAGDTSLLANYKKNLEDVIKMLPHLEVGLDVNVRFRNVTDFEFTQECLLFDMLNINLYHGWLCDPRDEETYKLIGSQSYNQLLEKVVAMQALQASIEKGERVDPSEADNIFTEGCKVKKFLDDSASQLTYYGITKLHEGLRDKEMAVFFRNNHFSTLYAKQGSLYLLVTDVGFQDEPSIAWEKFERVDGDAVFYTADFKLYKPSFDAQPVEIPIEDTPKDESSADDDFALAFKLQQMELQKQKEEKERRRKERERERRKEEEDDNCVIA